MIVSCIAAMAENGVIGRDGDLPWHLPADLKYFKRTTRGHPIVMGRRTWESIGQRALPRRTNVVVTGRPDYEVPEGVLVFASLREALEKLAGDEEIFLVGGAGIFAEGLGLADRLYLTIVHGEPEGDVRFPEIDWSAWDLVSDDRREADADHAFAHSFRVYERRL